MQKPTEYKLEDSNVENIGSAMDKAARQSAAVSECEWAGAGQVIPMHFTGERKHMVIFH
jgi:hypothetical protein